ncbi:LA2681 family HEPN domain-containing protein [Pseudoalteromonas sp. Angola-18]|uniref:LA2681 family HEPN domain-containing protein n=1 Tax=Pseudoalteromonas sp. Angola-18 TaxID=3025338 RepID=UPI002358248B|nr:LA2681 family HEPN domain-containing protein [Pseudoalteromonas sp. Angola-18]MDC9501696.1 LA2681 family HEPN domain-containing protein [Pseudoalteromonas sp. Angola-18]
MEIVEISEKLLGLIDDAPNQAIHEALQLSGNISFELLKAAILVDAGAMVKNHNVVLQGVEIFRNAVTNYQDNPELKYNLANGLHALALSTIYKDFSWYKETEDFRLEARQYFYMAANASNASLDIRSQSFTNLGNLLWSSYRWVEAYDFYTLALTENPRNGVASSGALKMLRYALQQELGDYELLVEEIEYLATHVKENLETIYSYAGGYGVKGIVDEIKDIRTGDRKQPTNECENYENFVVSNNLTLSPTIHSHEHDSKYWDNVNISSVGADVSGSSSVPEIFAMINILKSDYILARQLFYDASNRFFNETGNYNDTLNYACYGVNESALALAQRSALDILDKVAVATLSYLGASGAKRTSFKQAWFKKTKKGKDEEFNSSISQEIENGNTALLALTEVSRDLSNKIGFLSKKQASRNSSTHRFTVFHDMGEIPTSPSGCLEHFDYENFLRESLYTLKLARSTVIYFVQMVLIREKRLAAQKDGIAMPLLVPSHEDIRGHDE